VATGLRTRSWFFAPLVGRRTHGRLNPLRRHRLITLIGALTAGIGGRASGQMPGWALDARLAGDVERDRPFLSGDGAHTHFEDTQRLTASAGAEGELWLGDHVSLGGRVDTGDLTWATDGFTISGRDAAEEARETAFLREAWVAFEVGEDTGFRAEAGRRRATLGAGLLLDDFALGGTAELTHGPFGVRTGALVPGPDLVPAGPPIFFATLEYAFGAAGRVALLYARDTGAGDEVEADVARQFDLRALDAAAQRGRQASAVAGACLDPPPSTSVDAVLNWVGAEFEHQFAGLKVEAAWLTVFGHFDVDARLENERCIELLTRRGRPTSRHAETEALGHAASLGARYHLSGPWFPGFFGLWMSGNAGKPGAGGDYEGFLSIAPYPTRPDLFFDVGATSSVRTDRAATSGINGRGVWAFGPTLLFAPTEDLSFEATFAWLFADETNPATGGRDYGPEVDLRIDLDLDRRFSLFAAGAVTPLGDFHPERRTAWQAALGGLWSLEGGPPDE
jgi:hypothetical protein